MDEKDEVGKTLRERWEREREEKIKNFQRRNKERKKKEKKGSCILSHINCLSNIFVTSEARAKKDVLSEESQLELELY